MIMPKKGTFNKCNNFVMRIRCLNYKAYPYKKQYPIYYYKWLLASPNKILEKVYNEKNILRESEKKKNIEALPIIKEKRYRQRHNEIKTYNIKDREKLEKLYGISQDKIRNNSHHANSYNNSGISFKGRANYLYNNYINIRIGEYLLDRNLTKIYKGKLNSFAQRVKQNIHKNFKFSLRQNYCSICLEKFLEEDNITYLPCLHLFHENCIFEWLKRKKDCPVCKTNFP